MIFRPWRLRSWFFLLAFCEIAQHAALYIMVFSIGLLCEIIFSMGFYVRLLNMLRYAHGFSIGFYVRLLNMLRYAHGFSIGFLCEIAQHAALRSWFFHRFFYVRLLNMLRYIMVCPSVFYVRLFFFPLVFM